MTLILARASAEFVLQVTDRLVTNVNTRQPFDKVANKNILFVASNAVVAIAYTGDAYLDSVPTDHWIAEKLAGIKVDPRDPPMSLGVENKHQDVGQAFRILRDELATLDQRKRLYLLISVQGWQWNSKGRCRALVGNIRRTSANNAFGVDYEPRDWYLPSTAMTIATPDGNISAEEQRELSNRLRHKPASEAEDLMVDKIRDISQRNSWVGPNCISILLPPPSNPKVSIRYHPADTSALSRSQRLTNDQGVWAYSPWIVSPRMVIPPAQVAGEGFTLGLGTLSIHFASQIPEHPVYLMRMVGQKRPKLP